MSMCVTIGNTIWKKQLTRRIVRKLQYYKRLRIERTFELKLVLSLDSKMVLRELSSFSEVSALNCGVFISTLKLEIVYITVSQRSIDTDETGSMFCSLII